MLFSSLFCGWERDREKEWRLTIINLSENVLISEARHIPPEAVQVLTRIEEYVNEYHQSAQRLYPVVEKAARLHVQFVKIHPFIDGNGRTARRPIKSRTNEKNGYPPVIIIEQEKRAAYYAALDKAHMTDDDDDFIQLVVNALNKTFELFFKVV